MTKLRKEDLDRSYEMFLKDMAKFIGAGSETVVPAKLVIDDKPIHNKAEITSTNGRYFFRQANAYRDLYIPHADSEGVYFFFDNDDIAIYVGKSEVAGGIGRRVARHIGKPQGSDFPYLAFKDAQYVIALPFSEAPWLAPAFESYLLGNYQFRHNLSLIDREKYN
jgi:hypothetical protein